MELKKLLLNIERIFPSNSALDGDKIGLQVQSCRTEIDRILFALEVTEEVIEEAINLRMNCIIAFHPLIFRPLANIVDDERVGKLCSLLIKNDISLINIHTNFDVHRNGTNRILADKLGLVNQKFMFDDKINENTGMGIIGEFKNPLEINQLVDLVSKICYSPVKYSIGAKEEITRVGLICGSGSSFINQVLEMNLDAFITADVSYHTFHLTKNRLLLIDPGHYEMEQFVPEFLAKEILNEIGESIEYHKISSVRTNPVDYWMGIDNPKKMQLNYLNKLTN